MKVILFIFAICFVVVSGKVIKMPLMHSGTVRDRLVKEGKWEEEMGNQFNTGKSPLIDYWDNFYLINATLGTPGQRFTLVLDTGSSYLWVIDKKCTQNACVGAAPGTGYVKNRFDATKSTTFVNESKVFQVQYGIGSSNGFFGKDTFSVAGLSVLQQEAGIAESIATVFQYQPIDGTFGCAWPSLADHVIPPVQNFLSQLDQPIFTIWMDRIVKPAYDQVGGEVIFGGLNPENCWGIINWVPLTSKTYWEFNMGGFMVGDYSMRKQMVAISDTGTSWILTSQAYIDIIVTKIGAEWDAKTYQYTVNCTAEMPDLILVINKMDYYISSGEYVLDGGLGNGKCVVTIGAMSASPGNPQWNLGATFIRSYCQIYDIGNARIGFALAKHQILT
uniref:Peptidase A1 domain-containing protein n=1 Tax=Rhabditophanes sp. KR3021 TaxID=114890 RepID=A0AC35UC33_9BILA